MQWPEGLQSVDHKVFNQFTEKNLRLTHSFILSPFTMTIEFGVVGHEFIELVGYAFIENW